MEPVRESLRARRRQAAYEEVVDELGEFIDDSDYDDEKIQYSILVSQIEKS